MTIYKQGEVVDVLFPFIDTPKRKLRPAVVLSNAEFQKNSGACILIMVTSAERSRWNTDVPLSDWQKAGLKKPSIIRWKIFTLDEKLIAKSRGVLSDQDASQVKAHLKSVFS